jgi:hypothetical protein
MSVNSWIVKWYESTDAGYRRWFFRRITPDGSYFGEFESVEANMPHQTTIEGEISRAHLGQITSLVARIESGASGHEGPDERDGWTGLFAYGLISNPNILLRYRADDETTSDAASAFREVIEVLRPYTEI